MPCRMYDGTNDNVVINWYWTKCDMVINKERKCKSKQGRPHACAEMEKLYIAYMSTSLLTLVAYRTFTNRELYALTKRQMRNRFIFFSPNNLRYILVMYFYWAHKYNTKMSHWENKGNILLYNFVSSHSVPQIILFWCLICTLFYLTFISTMR